MRTLDIPGTDIIVLPPLMVGSIQLGVDRKDLMDMARQILEADGYLSRFDSDSNPSTVLLENYLAMVSSWLWGDAVIKWVGECGQTCKGIPRINELLSGNIWPNPQLNIFVQLLRDKQRTSEEMFDIRSAFGLRLAFLRPPMISCFSSAHLLRFVDSWYLEVYKAWAEIASQKVTLPPDRFEFDIIDLLTVEIQA